MSLMQSRKYDMIIFWDLEWVYDKSAVEFPKFGTKLNTAHIIEIACWSHDEKFKFTSKINCGLTVDEILINNFVEKNGFVEIVQNSELYPTLKSAWETIQDLLTNVENILFLSYGGISNFSIDFLVLKENLGNHYPFPSQFVFEDALSIIQKETKLMKKRKIPLGKLYFQLFGQKLKNCHNAFSDTNALKKIFFQAALINKRLNVKSRI
jgi:hypothetical protein